MNDNSIEEIEEITSLSQSNIKVKLFRARKKLNQELSLLLKDELKTILLRVMGKRDCARRRHLIKY